MNNSFIEYILEQLSFFDGISTRRMFGGIGVYRYGFMFAIIAKDRLYFKVGVANKPDYQEAGSAQFIYHKLDKEGKSKAVRLNYFEVPAQVMEDKDMLFSWMVKAHEAAVKDKNKEIV